MSIESWVYSEVILKKALEIAEEAHKGKFRRDGVTPYIEHPKAVADMVDGWHNKVVALLHDVLEDSDFIPEQMLDRGIPQEVVDDVVYLTHKKDESYADYIIRIKKGSRWCMCVKVADINHNLFSGGTSKAKVELYKLALFILVDSVEKQSFL